MLGFIARLLGVDTAIVWIIVALLGIASAGGLFFIVRDMGADAARIEQERRNNEAGIQGGEARLTRADCVRCGGVYHFDTRRCDGPPACYGD